MRNNFLSLFSSCILFALIAGCEKDNGNNNNQPNQVFNLRGNANSAQEVPTRVSTAATGTITGTYNRETNAISYTITWTGLAGGNPTAMHFHGPADPGIAANVQVPITGFTAAASGSVSGTATLTDAQEADLMNGLWYYNIHNSTYGGGEIRGQVIVTQW